MTCAVIIGLAGFATAALPASALVTGAADLLQQQLKQDSPIVDVCAGAGAAVRRTTVVGP
jgi:hypothetical protein